MRVSKHIGIIPDGNRRWAEANKMPKERGYECRINAGLILSKLCKEVGIKELTYYGFTTDNTKRPTEQRKAFTNACISAVNLLSKEGSKWLLAILNLTCFQKNYINIPRGRSLEKEELKLIMVGSGT